MVNWEKAKTKLAKIKDWSERKDAFQKMKIEPTPPRMDIPTATNFKKKKIKIDYLTRKQRP